MCTGCISSGSSCSRPPGMLDGLPRELGIKLVILKTPPNFASAIRVAPDLNVSFIRVKDSIPPLPSPLLVIVAPVITKLDLVGRQLRLLWSNKTFEAELPTEDLVDPLSSDVLECEDLGLDLLCSDKRILLDKPLHLHLRIVSDLPVLGASSWILLTRSRARNLTRNIGPSFSILGSSHPVIERVLVLHRVGALLGGPLDSGSLLSLSDSSRHDGSFVVSDGGIKVKSGHQYTAPGPGPSYWSK